MSKVEQGCNYGGGNCLNCTLAKCILDNHNDKNIIRPKSYKGKLTVREEQILSLVAKEGLTTIEIGQRLQMSSQTVKNHIFSARKLLGAKSIAHAVYIRYVVMADNKVKSLTTVSSEGE